MSKPHRAPSPSERKGDTPVETPVAPGNESISSSERAESVDIPLGCRMTPSSPRAITLKAYSGSVSILTLPLGQFLDCIDRFTTKRSFLLSGPSCHTTKLDDIIAPVLRILSASPVVTSSYMPSQHTARRSLRPYARSSGSEESGSLLRRC
jgi:hypothetical protein